MTSTWRLLPTAHFKRDVPSGEGQYRIRIGDYRIRYDIIGTEVILYSFKHRKAAY